MSSSARWVERLERATEYRDLEVVFSEIAAAASGVTNGQELADSIDEAIRRIEQERLRDEDELKAFEQQYAAFKEQQQGIGGWFRRHLPFSETRRKELEHRESIADQRAEVLADNLVIARAQMIKERLLPSAARRMGLIPTDWTARMDSAHSVERLSEFLAHTRGLADELARGKLFLNQLQLDVEAFAKADFKQAEDRQRKKCDLAAARGELGALQNELTAKEALHKSALTKLGRLVHEELLNRDPTYRQLSQRIQGRAEAQLPGKNLLAAAGELQVSLDRLLETDQQLRVLPANREQLANTLLKLQDDLRAAERDQADLAGQLKQHEEQHSAAARRAEQAASALAAAQRLQDAYRREQAPPADSQSAGSAGAPSAVEAEYSRLRAESQSAQTQLEIVRVPYEAIRQKWGEAQRRIESCQQQITESLRLQESLAQRESTLRQDLSRAQESMRPAFDNLRTQADRFRAAVKPLASTSALPALDSLSFHQSHHHGSGAADRLAFPEPDRDTASPYSQDKTILARFVESLQEQIKSIEKDLAQSDVELKRIWKGRCQELLGEPLPEDASGESL